jgi:monoamine oxidase
MLNLAKEFGLGLLDMEKDVQEGGLIKDTYFFEGKHYTEKELIAAFSAFAKKIEADIKLVEEEDEAALANFDMISIDQYLSEKGITGWLYEMLTKAYTSEMGMDSSKQSALNLLYMLDTDTSEGFKIYGDSDERYKIEGGNEKLIAKLSERLKGNIETNFACKKIEFDKKLNRYNISFANGKKVSATYLLIAIPFTALRKVELLIDLPEEKKRAINELGYGTSSKLIFGFNKQFWRNDGFSGYLFSDIVQNGWDSSAAQNNNAGEGSYTVFLGGEIGATLEESAGDTYLQQLYKIFPGTNNGFNNNRVVYNWSKNPNVNGGYASYAVGQWSSIAGNEQSTVGNIYFAGEHCSENFQGYMNGGAETGRIAAEGILTAMQPQ